MSEDRVARVRLRAYSRWEEEGRPEGRDLDHWLAAERDEPDDEAPPSGAPGITIRSPEAQSTG